MVCFSKKSNEFEKEALKASEGLLTACCLCGPEIHGSVLVARAWHTDRTWHSSFLIIWARVGPSLASGRAGVDPGLAHGIFDSRTDVHMIQLPHVSLLNVHSVPGWFALSSQTLGFSWLQGPWLCTSALVVLEPHLATATKVNFHKEEIWWLGLSSSCQTVPLSTGLAGTEPPWVTSPLKSVSLVTTPGMREFLILPCNLAMFLF